VGAAGSMTHDTDDRVEGTASNIVENPTGRTRRPPVTGPVTTNFTGVEPMREKGRILDSLEATYRSAFGEAEKRSDQERMEHLDFEFQRDQLFLEILLDVRDLLASGQADTADRRSSLVDRAKALKDLTKLR
jgi:hypothetical protein